MAQIYLFAIAYLISLTISLNFKVNAVFVLPIFVIYVITITFRIIRDRRLNDIYVLIGGLLWGLFVTSISDLPKGLPEIDDERIIFDGYVTESPLYNRNSTIYQVSVQRYILNERLFVKNFKMEYISYVPLAEPIRGDLIRGICNIRRDNEENVLICIGKSEEPPFIIERRGFSLINGIDEYKKLISKFIFDKYKGNIGSILLALSTGNSKELSYEVRRIFSFSGTSHILAISGTHIGLIAIILYYFIKIVLFPFTFIRPFSLKKSSSLFLIPLLLIVSFYFGNSPSVVRATSMVVVYLFSVLIERERDLKASLCLSFVLITSFSPDSIKDIGFQLSFLSVLGIILLVPSFLKEETVERPSFVKDLLRYLKALFLTSLSASLFTFPVVATHFGIFSLSGIFSNIMLVPFIGLISLPMVLLGVICYGISNGLASLLLNGAFVSLEQFYQINSFFAGLPVSYIKVFKPSLFEILIYYTLLLTMLFRNHITFKKVVLIAITFLLILSTLIINRVQRDRLVPTLLLRGGIILFIDPNRDVHLIADESTTNNDLRAVFEYLHKNRVVTIYYTNAGLNDDLYIKDHFYTKKEIGDISKSEGNDVLINFQNFYIFVYNDVSNCPPLTARYVISRRTSEEAIKKIFECDINADRLILAGRKKNPKIFEALNKYYKDKSSEVLVCIKDECEIHIEPTYQSNVD